MMDYPWLYPWKGFSIRGIDTILSDLKNATALLAGTFSLLNTYGYWLYNNKPDDEWGFMYPEKQDISFANRYPDLWPAVSQSSYFQKLTREYLVTSQYIIPLPEVRRSQKESYLILLSTITHEEMGTKMSTLLSSLFKIILYFSPVLIFISFFLAKITTQRNRYRQDLKQSALYDQLTKLPNRTLFKEQAEAQLELSSRYNRMMALAFVDLDGFKNVNDTFGHEVGDLLLKAVADRLKSCIRKADMVARIGGDEFIILLPEITSSDDCRIISEKVLASLSEEFTLKGSSARIGASIGVAIHSAGKDETLDDLTRRADNAMYEVKNSGKNSYRISGI
jgi:diguanylate cyclase (GGDEF)-like protein